MEVSLVDSHAHLDMPEFDADREEVLGRAAAAGVTAVLCPSELAEARSWPIVLDLVTRHPQIIAAAGVHPHRAKDFGPEDVERLRTLAARRTIRAVGEIGLDFHYELSPPGVQRDVLRRQLALAEELGLPAIIHSRLSGAEIIAAVAATPFTRGGILHCYTEGWEVAKRMLDLGFHISFSGILTFPKAGDLREVAREVPLDRLLVETDAPYLAPVPRRGRRNEPAFVVDTAACLAGLKGLSLEHLAEATTANFRRLFPGR
jgi:TatD DNase family protein